MVARLRSLRARRPDQSRRRPVDTRARCGVNVTKEQVLRDMGARFTWGPDKGQNRSHAYPDRCFAGCESARMHRSTHLPAALCGNAWAADWPVIDDPALLRCRSCERLLIGGWP